MRSNQGEAIIEMDFSDVIYQPIVRGMTPCTILADSLLVNIRMAGNTFGAGL